MGVLQFDTRINGEPPYKYGAHIRNFLCNCFAPQYSEGTMSLLNDLHFFGYNNQSLFSFKDLSKTTLSDWENFLDNNEVYLMYELSTPTEVFLTDEEVQAFKELATYYPTTNAMVTSDQLDGYTMFNYPVSMEKGWEYVKQQIGDTRKYVYDMNTKLTEAEASTLEAKIDTAILSEMIGG